MSEGPQVSVRRGVKAAVLVSIEEWWYPSDAALR